MRPTTSSLPSNASRFDRGWLPYRWDVRGDTVTIAVSYGPLDAKLGRTLRRGDAGSYVSAAGDQPDAGENQTSASSGGGIGVAD
jgi:hypothetical protein